MRRNLTPMIILAVVGLLLFTGLCLVSALLITLNEH